MAWQAVVVGVTWHERWPVGHVCGAAHAFTDPKMQLPPLSHRLPPQLLAQRCAPASLKHRPPHRCCRLLSHALWHCMQ